MANGQVIQSNGMATTAPQSLSFDSGATFSKTGKALNAEAASEVLDLKNPGPGVPVSASYTGYIAPKVSTTTISNSNKINQVPSIINKTNELSKTGINADANGNATYANGTLVPNETPTVPTSNLGASGISQGGYVGEVYYAPGAPLPTGVDGKPVQTTDSSPTDDRIMKSLDDQLAFSDAITADLIQGIKSQYAQLIQKQQEANKGQEAGVQNALLMGGVTGQGSSSQYAPISSSGIMSAQISYGIQEIADLTAKENAAITAAKIAGQQQKFQVMDKINSQINKIRDEKVSAAVKLNDKIAEQNQKLADEKMAATKDAAVADLYEQGVVDPKEILKKLNAKGLVINSKEVVDIISNINPDKGDVNKIALQAAQNGASPETVAKIQGAKTIGEALSLGTDSLGAEFKQKLEQQKFENNVQLQQLAISRGNLALSQRKQQLDELTAQGLGDPNQLTSLAAQYAATGQMPTQADKAQYGLIAEISKSLPKDTGTLVDKNTGIKPSTTGLSQDRQDGIIGLYNAVQKAKDLAELDKKRWGGLAAGTVGKVFGSNAQNDYLTSRDLILKELQYALSGKAITKPEMDYFDSLLPGRFNNPFGLGVDSKDKINSFINNLGKTLDDKLAGSGTSIYGYSKVKLSDGKNYTVGDIVSNGQIKGRVDPDGNITLLNE